MAVLAVLAILFGVIGLLLSGYRRMAVIIWVLVLSVIVMRQNNGFTTTRAVVALLIPLAIFIAVMSGA